MKTRAGEEEIERLLSDENLAKAIEQCRRQIGEKWLKHPRSKEWLEAHEEIYVRLNRDRIDHAGWPPRYVRAGQPRIYRHHCDRAEALQYIWHIPGEATVVIPIIGMEQLSMLLDGFGSSDRFEDEDTQEYPVAEHCPEADRSQWIKARLASLELERQELLRELHELGALPPDDVMAAAKRIEEAEEERAFKAAYEGARMALYMANSSPATFQASMNVAAAYAVDEASAAWRALVKARDRG